MKLINNCNIKALVKYKKLKTAKHSFLLDKIITGFKECSFLIAKALIMHKIGEDWWFNKKVINELPLVVYQDCYVINNPIFKLYIKKLWHRASLNAFNYLKLAFTNWKAKGGKGKNPFLI